MGIPAYFSHIIQNYDAILEPINHKYIEYLFIDANSIIYDCINAINFDPLNTNFEVEIINMVIDKINKYISTINPSLITFIAFDGQAPLAKLNQQQNRRYKTAFETKIYNKQKWNTSAISPGTKFMNSLNSSLLEIFKDNSNIILSLSDSIGEGEHKIFSYIRKNNLIHRNCVIYGLDADLIMLSLLHVKYVKNIYIYRETPDYISKLNINIDPNQLFLLNINKLNKLIPDTNEYIIIMFLLGNDFIPHCPTLNIRTTGIEHVLNAHKLLKTNIISSDLTINWKVFRQFIKIISDNELQILKQESYSRDKLSYKLSKKFNNTNILSDKINMLPIVNRNNELLINFNHKDWRYWYYKILFDIDLITNDENIIKLICINYLEAIEWTFKYYTNNCSNWQWKYNYHYAPLLSDLVKYIPYFNQELVPFVKSSPMPINDYLYYVLPKEHHSLIPSSLHNVNNIQFKVIDIKWEFCKYFWESHFILLKE